MRREEEIATVAGMLSRSKNAEHGPQADDIDVERVETSPSDCDERTFISVRKQRYKLFLSVLQKVNMCFLVLFVAFFVWTISVNRADGYSGVDGYVWNHSRLINSTNEVIIKHAVFPLTGYSDNMTMIQVC